MRTLFDMLKKFFPYLLRHGIRGTFRRIRELLSEGLVDKLLAPPYERYARAFLPTKRELCAQRKTVLPYMPLLSVVMPTYETPPKLLKAAVESVQGQSYGKWELCIADGASKNAETRALLQAYAAADARIKVAFLTENGGTSRNTNAAVALCTGEYVAFMDHDDTLTPDALFEVVRALNEHRADAVYSDEDKLSYDGKRLLFPHFKPDFSPHTMLSVNYMCHLCVVRREVLAAVGPLDPKTDGSQDHDLLLRVMERTTDFVHIPRVLYHWRMNEGSLSNTNLDRCKAAGRAAVKAHLERLGVPVKDVVQDDVMGYRVRYALSDTPRVSVVIPTHEHPELLKPCTDALLASTYPDLEIILVENNSKDPATFALYEELKKKGVRVVTYTGKFNFSAIVNMGAQAATGEYLTLLNNDVFLSTPSWAEEMTGVLQQKDVGAVGGRLRFPDDTLQHAGLLIGVGGVATSAYARMQRAAVGYMARSHYVCDVAAVTGALLMTKKSLFDRLGGLDEGFAVAYNDVDYCMRVREAGLSVVYVPYAEGEHNESTTRGSDAAGEKRERLMREEAAFRARYGVLRDPYYNENFGQLQYVLDRDRYRERKRQRRRGRQHG